MEHLQDIHRDAGPGTTFAVRIFSILFVTGLRKVFGSPGETLIARWQIFSHPPDTDHECLPRLSRPAQSLHCRSVLPVQSLPLLIVGIALFFFAQMRVYTLNSNDRLSVVVLAIVLVWMAGFVFCYGKQSFRAALFPLLFLLFMVPIPTAALDNIVLALQKGSAVMTYALFRLVGVPVLWQHFKFLLPGVEIEIAAECSGIRSSSALFITSMLDRIRVSSL